MSQTVGEDFCVGIYHENSFIIIGGNASNLPKAVEHLELQLRHPFVKHDLLEEGHEYDLTVSLASVSRLGLGRLVRRAALGNEHHWHSLLLVDGDGGFGTVVIEASIDLGHIMSLRTAGNSHVRERLHIFRRDGEVLHHAEYNIRSRHGLTVAFDQAVADNQNYFVAVRIICHSDGVKSSAKTHFSL